MKFKSRYNHWTRLESDLLLLTVINAEIAHCLQLYLVISEVVTSYIKHLSSSLFLLPCKAHSFQSVLQELNIWLHLWLLSTSPGYPVLPKCPSWRFNPSVCLVPMSPPTPQELQCTIKSVGLHCWTLQELPSILRGKPNLQRELKSFLSGLWEDQQIHYSSLPPTYRSMLLFPLRACCTSLWPLKIVLKARIITRMGFISFCAIGLPSPQTYPRLKLVTSCKPSHFQQRVVEL